VEKAHERHADAIILDLEDAVPAEQKGVARQALAQSILQAGQAGASILVRVNRGLRAFCADIEVAITAGIDALVLPKVDSEAWLLEVAEAVLELERDRGLVQGAIKLVAQIESPRALTRLEAIGNPHPRLVAMSLGPEDFSAAVGGDPIPELLLGPSLAVLFAARAAGVMPLGLVGSIGEFADLERYEAIAHQAKRLGFAGAMAIHPAQVAVLNRAFTPSPGELQWAKRILEAEREATAAGKGAFALDGRMVDPPVIRRAQEIIAISARIQEGA
jgi:citrate lyase subunit beta/citryl-CoA lyase